MLTPTKRTAHRIYNLNYSIVLVVRYRHQVVMADHAHLFVSAPPMIAPNTIARTIKSITAIAIFKAYPAMKQKRFWGGSFWSDGCYYGSAGTVSAATIAKYIANQKSKPE